MSRSIREKIKNPDVWVPILGAVIIALCGYLLYVNMTGSRGTGSEPIGKIYFKNRVAQRKFAARTLWGNLETDSIVYNRDTIRTEELSEAVIELTDGTRIEMDENSMIVLNISQQEADINFAYGAINAKRSTSSGEEIELQITKGDKVVKSTDGDIKLAGEKDSEDLVVTLESGQAVIEKGGEATELKENQQAVVTEEAVDVKPLVLRLSSPPELAQVFTGAGAAPVSFAWDKGEAPEVRLEVARDRSFSKVAAATNAGGAGAALNLPEGNYYWRISARGQAGRQTSSTRRFRVVKRQAVRLFSPLNGQKFSYAAEAPLVNFSWEKDRFASGYSLQIASNAGFSGARSIDTLTTSVTRTMEPGTYYWKVATRSSRAGAATESQVFRFTVTRLQKQEPPRPLHPRGRSIHQVLLRKQGEMFNWLANREIKTYEMELARDRGFQNRVVQKTTSGNFVRIQENLQPGAYFWRVRGRDGRGLWTDFSRPAAFSVGATEKLKLRTPVAGKTFNIFELDTRGLALAWNKAGRQGNYRILLGTNANLAGARSFGPQTSTTLRVKDLGPGTYYWKVALLDGNETVTESDPRSFRITGDLPAPTIAFPRARGRVDMTERERIDFRWNAVTGADEYDLVFSRIVGGRPVVLARERTRATTYRFTKLDQLDRGPFVFEVRARARKGGTQLQSQPARSNFRIELEPLPAPELDSATDLYIEE